MIGSVCTDLKKFKDWYVYINLKALLKETTM